MKATAYLGCMPIEFEASDEDPLAYQKLIERTWSINRLNMAAVQEGWNPRDCVPFAELGAPGADGKRHKYCGFVHMPTGEKIRYGQQTGGAGGHWYVRSLDDEHYRGPEKFLDVKKFFLAGAEEPAGELPAHQDPALDEAPPEFSEEPKPERRRRPPVKQASFDTGGPANEKQKKALGKLTTAVLGFDDWSFTDQSNLFDSLGFQDVNKITEAEAAELISALNQSKNKNRK